MKKALVFLGLAVTFFVTGAPKWDLKKSANQVHSFAVTVGTTPTRIQNDDEDSITEVRCSNISATKVFFGGSDVDTTDGYPVCHDATLCTEDAISIAATTLYAVVASGTVAVRCISVSE